MNKLNTVLFPKTGPGPGALVTVFRLLQDLVVRIVFILGNLTAKNNQAREQFSKEKGSIPTLLSLFRTFYKLDLCAEKGAAGAEQPQAPRPRAQAEDVLIKLTRVLANLAIHPGIGPALAANPYAVGLLLATLGKARAAGRCCLRGTQPRARRAEVSGAPSAHFNEPSQLQAGEVLFCSELPQK